MSMITRIKTVLCALLALSIVARAAEPAAEQLLPGDTGVFFSIRDTPKYLQLGKEGNYGQLWNDPLLKPFRTKFENTFSEKALAPLEKALGLKLSQLIDLVKGQATAALIPQAADKLFPADFVLILDSGDSSAALKTNLTEWSRKWTTDGRVTKTEKVRDVEFQQITIPAEALGPLSTGMPWSDKDEDSDKANTNKVTFLIGQSKSLLLISTGVKALEKIVSKQQGAQVEVLSDRPAFENSRGVLRDGQAVAWVSIKTAVDALKTTLATMKDLPMGGMNPDAMIKGLGLEAVTSLAFKAAWAPDGLRTEWLLGVPQADRKGLFKLFEPLAKDSAPPAFVAANTLSFSRVRVDLKKSWETLESTLNSINPAIGGLLQMTLASAGKDKDPNFDLKKNLIGNLGDDIITIVKAGATSTNKPVSLRLIGSPNANELVGALRTAAALLPTGPEGLKEREFLGRKIYTLGSASDEDGGEGLLMHLSANNGYLAVSESASLLEEYLRATEADIKPLKAAPGLAEAAEQIGGLSTGFFTYRNDRELMRQTFENLRKDGSLDGAFGGPANLAGSVGGMSEKAKEFEGWFDWTLLPPYDQISKYFHLSVNTVALTPQGYSYKEFSPTPPGIKK